MPYYIAETTMPGKTGFDFNGASQGFNMLAEYLFEYVHRINGNDYCYYEEGSDNNSWRENGHEDPCNIKAGFLIDEDVKLRESKLRDALRSDSQFQVKQNASVEVSQRLVMIRAAREISSELDTPMRRLLELNVNKPDFSSELAGINFIEAQLFQIKITSGELWAQISAGQNIVNSQQQETLTESTKTFFSSMFWSYWIGSGARRSKLIFKSW